MPLFKNQGFWTEFWANLLSGALLAILFGSFLKWLIEKLWKPKPDLDLFFNNRMKEIDVAPSESGIDYDVSFQLTINNKGKAPLEKGKGLWHLFIPLEAHLEKGRETMIRTSGSFHHCRGEIKEGVGPGFTDLEGTNFLLRFTNPIQSDAKIFSYIQTDEGYFPKSLKISQEGEIIETGGVLTIRFTSRHFS